MTSGDRNEQHALTPHATLRLTTLVSLVVRGVLGDVREQRRRRLVRPQRSPRPLRRRLSPRVLQPVFVLGSPRSGTTFLGECLGSVPSLSYHFEPRLTKAAARYVYDNSWSPSRARRVFRWFYGVLLLANGHGGLRFAEKNPENCFLVSFLAHAFPDALFVHIVRDGRDAAVSHAKKPWLQAGSAQGELHGRGGTKWGPAPRFWVETDRRQEFAAASDLQRTAWAWRRFTQAAVDGLNDLPTDRWVRVRYEHVVTDPDAAATALGEFLGFTPTDLHHLRAALRGAVQSSLGRWKADLRPPEILAVSRECGPLQDQLGYE